jgi:hypothetical protein
VIDLLLTCLKGTKTPIGPMTSEFSPPLAGLDRDPVPRSTIVLLIVCLLRPAWLCCVSRSAGAVLGTPVRFATQTANASSSKAAATVSPGSAFTPSS